MFAHTPYVSPRAIAAQRKAAKRKVRQWCAFALFACAATYSGVVTGVLGAHAATYGISAVMPYLLCTTLGTLAFITLAIVMLSRIYPRL